MTKEYVVHEMAWYNDVTSVDYQKNRSIYPQNLVSLKRLYKGKLWTEHDAELPLLLLFRIENISV